MVRIAVSLYENIQHSLTEHLVLQSVGIYNCSSSLWVENEDMERKNYKWNL